METKTVYVVRSPDPEDMEDIYGVFDSKEMLDDFLDRFKDRGDGYRVVELPVNPKFRGDKNRSPYFLTSHRSGETNLFVISNPYECEKAFAEAHEIIKMDGKPMYLNFYILAETKREAWDKGISRLKKMVELGEFELDAKIFIDDDELLE